MHERVVLGMIVTIDEELIWDEGVVDALIAETGVRPDDLFERGQLDGLHAMVATLITHLASGSGAEHYVTTPEPLLELATRFSSRRTLGGTGVRAGLALAALGTASTAVMAAVDPDVRRLLPRLCRPVAAHETEALVPHVIFQYPAGATVHVGDRTVVAPAPNRVIFAHDVPNEQLPVPATYPSLVAGADVVLVSSLNAVRDDAVLARRIEEITAALEGARPDATLIWEDAAYHVPSMALDVAQAMAAHVHVVSMNEDELQSYLGRRVDLLRADDVARAVHQVRDLVGARTLVVHTRWWALAVGEDAARYRAALRGGISTASARFAYGDAAGSAEYAAARTWSSDPRSTVLAAALDGIGIACESGVLPPTQKPTTIGLGDAFAGGFVGVLASTYLPAGRVTVPGST